MRTQQRMLLLRAVTLVLTAIAALNGCGDDGAESPPESTPFDSADLVRGGQLYDKWWEVSGVLDPSEPTSTNPGYALTQGTRTGADTWRCKECHGWDYRGKDGAYAAGASRHTGVEGLMHATGDSPNDLFGVIKGGLAGSGMSPFASHLSDRDIWDVVKFIKEGIIDETRHIDYSTKTPIGANASHGLSLFNSTCALCHGSDGRLINFGNAATPEFVGTVASDNPWEFLHKVRFGQPGAAMPSGIRNGWSTQDVVDVLGYAQTLPAE